MALTFAAGEASKTIAVKVAGDTTVEPNETFRLTLSNPSGATLGTSVVAVATISNDDTGSNAGAAPELTQGFLKVSAGLTSAFSTNNTPANTDDKTGSYQLVGTEKITVMGLPKQGLTLDSAEMATLLGALTEATDVAGFVAAVVAAQAKLDLKFAVSLGDSVNIDGVAGGDAGAYANLIYQGSAASGTEIRFGAQDAAAPTLSQTAPLDDATGVAIGSDIVLTFNEPVQAGSGSIVISSGTDTRTIAVTDSQVTIAGSTVTINPTNDLQPGAAYSVQMASGVLKDMANNAFAGISGSGTYNFTTVTASGTGGDPMGSTPMTVRGSNGNDSLTGGSGSDVLIGGAGNDSLTGELGNDVFVFDQTTDGTAWDLVTDFDPANDLLQVIGFQGLHPVRTLDGRSGIAMGDFLTVADSNGWSTATVSDGRLVYESTSGSLIYHRGDGTSNFNYMVARLGSNLTVSSLNIVVGAVESTQGIAPDALVAGTSGNDTLSGGVSNDVMIGGAGNDSLTGSVGNNIFCVRSGRRRQRL